jgi:hypothetical protein
MGVCIGQRKHGIDQWFSNFCTQFAEAYFRTEIMVKKISLIIKPGLITKCTLINILLKINLNSGEQCLLY